MRYSCRDIGHGEPPTLQLELTLGDALCGFDTSTTPLQTRSARISFIASIRRCVSVKISLSRNNFDFTENSAQLDVLRLPHVKVEKLFLNDMPIDSDGFTVRGDKILIPSPPLTDEDNIHVYLDIGTQKILNERYVAIIVALIGFFGTISGVLLQTPWLGRFFDAPSFFVFEPDQYGIKDDEKKFVSIMRWEEPSEKNYSFTKDVIDNYYGYAIVRLRTSNEDIRLTKIEDFVGPTPIRNGTNWEVPIPDDLLTEYNSTNTWMQLIVFALPQDMRPTAGQSLSALGKSVKILMAPAVRRRP